MRIFIGIALGFALGIAVSAGAFEERKVIACPPGGQVEIIVTEGGGGGPVDCAKTWKEPLCLAQ